MVDPKIARNARRLPTLLAAVGVLSSLALEWLHVRAYLSPSTSSFCSVGAALDCDAVALSPWAVVAGVPLPVFGVAGFVAAAVAGWRRSALLLPLALFGSAASALLLLVELFSVGSVCLLCEVVHVTWFALAWAAWVRRHTVTPSRRPSLREVALTLGTPTLLLVGTRFFLPPYWALTSWKTDVFLPHGKDEGGQPWMGGVNAEFVLHEYTDYGCPHCAVATSRIQRLLLRHPERVRIVRHQQPRMTCPVTPGTTSCLYARTAYCAEEQERFWQMDAWLFHHAPGRATIDLGKAASEVGLDVAKLRHCIDRADILERAAREEKAAHREKVRLTPMYILNGERLTPKELEQKLAPLF